MRSFCLFWRVELLVWSGLGVSGREEKAQVRCKTGGADGNQTLGEHLECWAPWEGG